MVQIFSCLWAGICIVKISIMLLQSFAENYGNAQKHQMKFIVDNFHVSLLRSVSAI